MHSQAYFTCTFNFDFASSLRSTPACRISLHPQPVRKYGTAKIFHGGHVGASIIGYVEFEGFRCSVERVSPLPSRLDVNS